MTPRFPFSGFARQFQADVHVLIPGRNHARAAFKDRMIAVDRMAGTTTLACVAGLSVWFISQVIPVGLLDVPGAYATTPLAASHDAPTSGLSALVAAKPMTVADIRKLQSKLEGLRFEPGMIDGIVGGRTLDALNHYRETKNLTRVSTVDYATVAGLLD